jgi:hypothetical protein
MQRLNKSDRRELTVISFEITFDGAESRRRRADPSSSLPSIPSPAP